MLTLAIDTATADVVVGIAEGARVLAERRTGGPARHGETVTPAVALVLAEAGCAIGDLDALVVGTGPGPFTGLRVGMVSAASLADALGVPVYGVCSLDAVVLGLSDWTGTTVVATDARRREVYWAIYVNGERVAGPSVDTPAELLDRLRAAPADRVVGAGAVLYDLPGALAAGPTVAGLLAAAGPARTDRRPAAPLCAAYLRRPDAVELAARTPAGRP
ncbi:MAG: tRNA (adenosine(37)-N6)-threonylcarbamoyltransferase complex dimerization subunit type 1 TsaB [Geodermatophilaceae bacterium]